MSPPESSAPRVTAPIRPVIEALEDSRIVEVWKLGFEIPDVIGLWVGEGDLPTPAFICEPAAAALKRGETFYAQKRGIPELRQALIDYHRRLYGITLADDRIAVTSAGMNAMMLAMETLVGPGDNAVCVTPVWPNIFATAEIMGAAVRHLPLSPTPSGWRLDLDRLFAACDERTRVIYVASPGNPTGWVMSRAEQQAVLDFARRRGIWILADEVYARLIYDGDTTGRLAAPSFLELAAPDDPLVIVNSFSKAWAMTGWRIGWMVMPARLTAVIDKLIEFNTSGAQPFLQHGCVAALRDGEPFVAEMVARYRAGRELVLQRLGGMRRVRIVRPEAAFYVMFGVDGMTDSLAFAKRLVHEARVGLAPGSAFGPGGEGHLRLCFASSPERLSQAMDRLAPALG
ncbi:MAG TPA: pyridoxal phosphate-dependent aminotransferase [Methylomirabilota bacterium]|nr:pyridoxal phosphate-dependent aminotransferase [Methylomirabilota bacterium]